MKPLQENIFLKIAICEDNADEANLLKSLIVNAGFDCHIDTFESGESLLEAFYKYKYNIVFLDIYLGGMTGVEAARCIRKADNQCCFVFTTISREHALESYELETAHYLVKPILQHDVSSALARCQKSLMSVPARRSISVSKNKNSKTIFCDDIQYAEIFNKECLIHTLHDIITVHMSIDDLSQELPTPPFLRCHRSYIVNMDYIDNVDRDFLMKNGATVYIRQSDARRIKNKYAQYLIERARSLLIVLAAIFVFLTPATTDAVYADMPDSIIPVFEPGPALDAEPVTASELDAGSTRMPWSASELALATDPDMKWELASFPNFLYDPSLYSTTFTFLAGATPTDVAIAYWGCYSEEDLLDFYLEHDVSVNEFGLPLKTDFVRLYINSVDDFFTNLQIDIEIDWILPAFDSSTAGSFTFVGIPDLTSATLHATDIPIAGELINPSDYFCEIHVNILAEPLKPRITDVLRYYSIDYLCFDVPYLSSDDIVILWRSDDEGETWYKVSQDFRPLSPGFLELPSDDLAEDAFYGFKVEVVRRTAHNSILSGTSDPVYIRLDDTGEFTFFVDGDRGGDGRLPGSTRPPTVQAPPSGSTGSSSSGSSDASSAPPQSAAVLTTLRPSQLDALTKVYPKKVPFINGSLTLMLPSSYLDGLGLSTGQSFSVSLETKLPSFTVGLSMNGRNAPVLDSVPFTVVLPFQPAQNTNSDQLVCLDQSGKVISGSFFDAKRGHMIMRSFRSGTFTIAAKSGRSFSDSADHRSVDAIAFLSARGIVNGTAQNRFRPDADSTHAEFITMLSNLHAPALPTGFTDHWYAPHVRWASGLGLTTTSLSAEKTMTYKEAVTYLQRYAALIGVTFQASDVLTGFTGESLHPDKVLTRAQCAEILKKFMVSCYE